MNGEFRFRPVGHGLFYTGNIKNGNAEDLNFIYDIGSLRNEARINLEVDEYCKEINRVDFVILSHLHEDHINGLYHLLSSGIEIDAIIMPYINPSCLMVLFEEVMQKIYKRKKWYYLSDDYKNLFDFYSEFYLDPYSCISELKENCKIITFYTDRNIHEIETLNGNRYVFDGWYNKEDELLKSFDKSGYVINKSDNNTYFVHPNKKTDISYKGWCFYFKQPKINLAHKNGINRIIKEVFGVLLSNASNKEKKEKMKEARDYIKNNDCITLEHYPINSKSGKEHTLLTGDYDEKEIYDGVLSLYNEYFVIQIPHHGSGIPTGKVINTKTNYSVVCYRKGDKKHPNVQTLQAYEKVSINPIQHVTLKKDSYFEYSFDEIKK